MMTMEDFQHPPLKNPAKDIRLLRCINPAGSDGVLSFQISSWPVDKAPQYNAISYTWGEMVFTTVIIDGRVLRVRRNCHQALVQSLGYSPASYLWIDSICINQDDVNEKNHQVARMYLVYRHAKQVLACVGPHENDSQFLIAIYSAIISRGLVRYLQDTEASTILAELAQDVDGLNPEEIVPRLQAAWMAFARRPYWNRLWIVQEIVAGDENAIILCGMDSIPWSEVNVVESLLLKLGRESRAYVSHTPYSNLMQLSSEISWSEDTGLPLHDLVLQLDAAECADHRDRIYGLLALIDWEASGLNPILPDYTRSAWDLAVYLVAALGPYDCRHIMRRLRIDATTTDMQKLIEEREAPDHCPRASRSKQTFDFQRMVFLRLYRDDRGRLTSPCNAMDHQWVDPAALLSSLEMTGGTDQEDESRRPRKVFCGDQIIAIVHEETQHNDILAFTPFHQMKTDLVLRHTKDNNLDVVGSAFVLLKSSDTFRQQIGRHGMIPGMEGAAVPKDAMFQAELHLSATAEDLIVIFHAMDSGLLDANRFLRIRPVENPTNAAKITPWRYGHEAEAYWEMNRVHKLQMSEQMNERGL